MSKIYFITSKDEEHAKVGVSKNPHKRIKQLQTGNWNKLYFLRIVDCGSEKEAYDLEAQIHKEFKSTRLVGEWFTLDKRMKKFYTDFNPNVQYVERMSKWWYIVLATVGYGVYRYFFI